MLHQLKIIIKIFSIDITLFIRNIYFLYAINIKEHWWCMLITNYLVSFQKYIKVWVQFYPTMIKNYLGADRQIFNTFIYVFTILFLNNL